MNSREQYLQLRIQKLNTMLENADRMIRRLIEDAEMTESIGCAFALDLGAELESIRQLSSDHYRAAAQCVEGALEAHWNEGLDAMRGIGLEEEKAP